MAKLTPSAVLSSSSSSLRPEDERRPDPPGPLGVSKQWRTVLLPLSFLAVSTVVWVLHFNGEATKLLMTFTATTSTTAFIAREKLGPSSSSSSSSLSSSFLPMADWEKPGLSACETQRPTGMPEYCCYGGKAIYRKHEKATCQNHSSVDNNFDVIQPLEWAAYMYSRNNSRLGGHAFRDHAAYNECDECVIYEYLYHNNWTLTFLGDSVHGQHSIGFECALRARNYPIGPRITYPWARNKTIHWKVGLREIQLAKLLLDGDDDNESPGTGTDQNRDHSGRIAWAASYWGPTLDTEMQYVLQNSDVVVFDHGVHWMTNRWKEFHSDMIEYLVTIREALVEQHQQQQSNNPSTAAHTQTKLIIWRESAPQHFPKPGGYYKGGENAACSPITGQHEAFPHLPSHIDYRTMLMRNATLAAGLHWKDASHPEFLEPHNDNDRTDHDDASSLKIELIYVGMRSYAFGFHNIHVHGNDCTHFCNNRHIWASANHGIRLAMDRHIALQQRQKQPDHSSNDMMLPRNKRPADGFATGNFVGKYRTE